MEIIRTRPDSQPAPEDWFTGEVWLEGVAVLPPPSRQRVLNVHFNPGARTAWHSHPYGQVLIITNGIGLIGLKGGPVEEIRAGDVVHIDAGEEHWHGGASAHFMTHLALQEADDDGNTASWGDHVSDEEYLSQHGGA